MTRATHDGRTNIGADADALLAGDPGERFWDARTAVFEERIAGHLAEEEKPWRRPWPRRSAAAAPKRRPASDGSAARSARVVELRRAR